MRAVAQRITHLNDEIATHEQAPATLVDQPALQLVAEIGDRFRHRGGFQHCVVTSGTLPQRSYLKRYIARRVWRLLEHQTPPQTTT